MITIVELHELSDDQRASTRTTYELGNCLVRLVGAPYEWRCCEGYVCTLDASHAGIVHNASNLIAWISDIPTDLIVSELKAIETSLR